MSLHSHIPVATESDDARAGGRAGVCRGAPRPSDRPARSALVTSRNNSDKINWAMYDSPLREPRRYVEKCGQGSLALMFEAGSVAFAALTCNSWSCPHCRRQKAAQLLDRLRRGMETRADYQRTLVTLTLNPADFGARPIGIAYWDAQGNRTTSSKAQRRTTLWSEPTKKQFQAACEAMSNEWNRLNDRLRRFCEYRGFQRVEYFRVVELHRNVWPHYHVVLEHPDLAAEDLQKPLKGWKLGRIDVRSISLDDAVGELAPYLVSTEKGKGSKAYQFAATALPKGFRLFSSSQGFLGAPEEPERIVQHSFPVEGHFKTHHDTATSWGADARIVLPPAPEPGRPPRLPGSSLITGDAATLYYLQLLEQQPVHLTPEHEAAYRDADLPPNPARSAPGS